ncbi:MAG: histidine kinase, partial [Bradyrhizobium sp.]|nr:histidine kinase [Bradyrhizobium sp.]
MSEIAAKASMKAPAKPVRRRLLAPRLVPYLLLQALIVIATILGLGLLQPRDPDDLALNGFSLRQEGVTHPVTLPHFTASRYSLADPPLYTGTFTFRR